MHIQTEKRPLLTDVIHAFAAELQQLLEEWGEPELAAQVPGLVIFGRCRCGDDFCGTFYAQPKPEGDRDLRVWVLTNEGLMGAYSRTAHHHSVICYLLRTAQYSDSL